MTSFYDKEVPIDGEGLDMKWTPAEVNQILFRNFEDPEAAVDELIKLRPSDLYGFSDENGSAIATDQFQ